MQQALTPQAELPGIEPIARFREEHTCLQGQLRESQHRLQELGNAKAEHERLNASLREKEKELASAEAALGQFFQPLGKAAFAGLAAGKVQPQAVFDGRSAVQRRIGELKVEQDQLAPSSDSGMVQKTKAKAQQLMVAGQIKLEEMKIGKLEEQIGKELIASNQEESVRCDETSDILAGLAKQRAVVAQWRQEANQAQDALAKKKQQWGQALEVTSIEGGKSFDAALRSCQAQIAQIESQRTALERQLPDRLLASEAIQDQGTLGSLLRSLRDAHTQLLTIAAAQPTRPGGEASARAPNTAWPSNDASVFRQRTALGLSLIYYSIIAILVLIVPLVVGSNATADATRMNRTPGTGMVVLSVVGNLGLIVAYIFVLVGPLLCLSAPPKESGGKGFLIASIVLQWVGVPCMILAVFLPGAAAGVLALLSQLIGVVVTVLFVLFMKKLALHFGREDFADRAKRTVVGVTIVAGLAPFAVAIMVAAGPSTGAALIPCLIVGVGGVVVLVMYANLLNDMRKAIRTPHLEQATASFTYPERWEPVAGVARFTAAPRSASQQRLRPGSALSISYTIIASLGALMWINGVGILIGHGSRDAVGTSVCLASVPLLLTAFILSLIWLYRAWSIIPLEYGGPSPGAAVGLLLVPFFNIYWMFRVIPGLSQRLERLLIDPQTGRGKRAGYGIGVTACILLLIPYLNVIGLVLFIVWINIANAAKNRVLSRGLFRG